MTNKSAEHFLAKLQQRLEQLGPVAVAVSGGVDSMTLAIAANRLNSASRMYHAVSPAVPVAATERIKRYALQEDWQLHFINAREMEDSDYRRNPVNRCYFCKSNLYSTILSETNLTIVSGTNTDDLHDFRPGLSAAEQHRVVHPFVDVDIDKQTVRAIAKLLGLNDVYDLPAAPCLSSRITTGIAIDEQLLPIIDRVESDIWRDFGERLNLSVVRCRILPGKIAIQLQGVVDFERSNFEFNRIRELVKTTFYRGGFDNFHHISIEPYQQGSAFIRNNIPVINM